MEKLAIDSTENLTVELDSFDGVDFIFKEPVMAFANVDCMLPVYKNDTLEIASLKLNVPSAVKVAVLKITYAENKQQFITLKKK